MGSLDALIGLIDRHAVVDGIHASALPGVCLIRCSTPTMPMPVIYEPTACIVAQGRKRAVLGTTSYVYDPAEYLVASVGLPVVGSVIEASVERPYLSLQVNLDARALAELAIRHPATPARADHLSTGLSLSRSTPALLDATVRLVRLLDTPGDIDALAGITLQEMLYRLLTGPNGDVVRSMAHAGSRLNQVARAIAWLRAHYRERCPIGELAQLAGMSRSSFHAHFKAVTSMTPLAFRTHLRMVEARRLMVGEALDAASAGYAVGYESPSQFSRDYVRLFGMPPSRHAAALRRR